MSNVHNSSWWLLNSIFLHLSCSPKWGGGAIFSCITHQLQTRGLFHFSQWEHKTQIQKKADARSCRMRKLISSLGVKKAKIVEGMHKLNQFNVPHSVNDYCWQIQMDCVFFQPMQRQPGNSIQMATKLRRHCRFLNLPQHIYVHLFVNQSK